MSKLNYKGSVIAVTGAAGSGKDTLKDLIQANITNEILVVSFAETLKRQFATALFLAHPEILKRYSDETLYIDALNDLKDHHPEIMAIGNMHTRAALQVFGTEVYRSIDENVHVRYMAAKMIDAIQNNPDVVFFSNDVRFPNELDFFLKLGQLKDKGELDNYLRNLVSQAPNYPTFNELTEKLSKEFKVPQDDEIIKHLNKIIDNDLSKLKNAPKPTAAMPELKTPAIRDINPLQSFNLGLISLFRPLIDPSKRVSKNLTESEVDKLVKDFNKFTDEELKIQKDGYKANQLEWSIDSIKSQGYVRPGINIFHPSETSLLTLLPEQKTISYPMRRDSEALNKSVLDLLRSQSVTATNTVDNKEKLDKTANSTISSIKP